MADATLPNNGDAMRDIDTNDVEANIEAEIKTEADAAAGQGDSGMAGATDGANERDGIHGMATTFESRIPAKKDITLREFLGKMDDYAPIVRFSLLSTPILRALALRATKLLVDLTTCHIESHLTQTNTPPRSPTQ